MSALLQDPGLAGAVEYVYGLSDRIPSRPVMRRLVHRMQEVLDLQDPLEEDLASVGLRIVRVVREVFAAAVLIFSIWTVVGAILAGTNEMSARTSPTFTLTVLVGALGCLALLEAAHIGAVALSTADVSELRNRYPRVYKLHRHIATPALLEHYLAARQVGVVMIVFVIAEVTRTVGLRQLPGTTIPLPTAMDFVFQIGAPGALLVLIIAQVAPQLITARRPAQLMNTLPMALAFSVTRAIGTLGLARPASWLVAFSKRTERIASAKRQRYTNNTIDVLGLGIQTIIREIRVARTASKSITETTVLVYEGGRTFIEDCSATVPVATSGEVTPEVTISRDGEVQRAVVSLQGGNDTTGNCHTAFIVTAMPTIGAFQSGDVVHFSTPASLRGYVGSDSLIISEPTKLAVMRIILDDPPTPLPPAKMTVQRGDDRAFLEHIDVPPHRTATGKVEFIISVSYPDPGTIITLSWNGELTY